MRRGCGGEKTNEIQVGAILESDWLFTVGKRQSPLDRGLPFGQYRYRPYHDLWWTFDDAYNHRNPIRRPTLATVRRKSI
jgi:hypothetical protein